MASHTTQHEVSENTLQTNKDILASLCTKADLDGNQEVKACLRAYNITASLRSLKTNLNKFTKDALLKTLMFLHLQSEGTQWKNLLKHDVVNEVICRIQNLLCDTCGICGIEFATKLEEKLLLKCKLCGQNTHLPCLQKILGTKYHDDITSEEVLRVINPLGLQGLHYLCLSCSDSTIPKTTLPNSKNNGSPDDVTQKTIGTNTRQRDDEENSSHVVDNVDNNKTVDNPIGSVDKNGCKSSDALEKTWRERNDLCKLFLAGKCPNGISGKNCQEFHPRVCNRYRKNGSHTKYGCGLGNACKFFHPNICPNSMKSRTCYNSECSHRWHLPKTKRIAPAHTHTVLGQVVILECINVTVIFMITIFLLIIEWKN